MLVRTGLYSDKEELARLWKISFDDEDCFVNWFFDQRFMPEYISVAVCDGKIVSALHSLPVKVRLREKLISAILISGVSTLAEYRRRGYMHEVMKYHIARMRERGFLVSVLKAVSPDIYFSLEHQVVNDEKIVYIGDSSEISDCKTIDIMSFQNDLYKCYDSFSNKYSGIIKRNLPDFELKSKDYLSGDGKCAAFYNGTEIEGYCIYFESENKICGDECVALSDSAYDEIAKYFASYTAEEKRIKAAVDVNFTNAVNTAIMPGNSAYSIDVSKLLSITGLKGYGIEVTDSVQCENNRVYDLSGRIKNATPDLKISNGYLTQWIFGYTSIKELWESGLIELINDNGIIDYMDSIGKCICYIVDEY